MGFAQLLHVPAAELYGSAVCTVHLACVGMTF